jgi:hypothetical protein
VRVFSDENDFGKHKGVDQDKTIVKIQVAELLKQEHLVRRNRAKEKRQIQKDSDKLLKLMGDLLP